MAAKTPAARTDPPTLTEPAPPAEGVALAEVEEALAAEALLELPEVVLEAFSVLVESDEDLRVTLEEEVEAEPLLVSVVTATDVVLVVATEAVEVESSEEEEEEVEVEETDEEVELAEVVVLAALPLSARAIPVLSARKEE